MPFRFGNLISGDYHGDSLNVMFSCFHKCFQPFLLVFPHVSSRVSTVPFHDSSVSLQYFCCALFYIVQFYSSATFTIQKLKEFEKSKIANSMVICKILLRKCKGQHRFFDHALTDSLKEGEIRGSFKTQSNI